MSKKKKNTGPGDGNRKGEESGEVQAEGQWTERKRRVRWKDFPVPGKFDQAMRITFSAQAYADAIGHAKKHLEEEVCGILVGEFCEDDDGIYVSVQNIIEGSATKKSSSHVTFTHETWNDIHKKMDEEYPKKNIVGWYHSHPGFGVEFSDMDLFIQKNFFSGNGQIAFVCDPLGSEEALCVMKSGEIRHLSRFWVHGRERTCRLPAAEQKSEKKSEGSSDVNRQMESVEQRLRQALQALEALRTSYHRFLTAIGMIVAVGVMFYIANTLIEKYWSDSLPPEVHAFSSRPVKIGDEWRWVGATLMTKPLDEDVRKKLEEREEKILMMKLMQEQAEKSGKTPESQKATGTPETQKASGDNE